MQRRSPHLQRVVQDLASSGRQQFSLINSTFHCFLSYDSLCSHFAPGIICRFRLQSCLPARREEKIFILSRRAFADRGFVTSKKKLPALVCQNFYEQKFNFNFSRCVRSISRCVLSISRCVRSISRCVRSISGSVLSISRCVRSISRCVRSISGSVLSISRCVRSISRCVRSISGDIH
jgi:hypothetical protein